MRQLITLILLLFYLNVSAEGIMKITFSSGTTEIKLADITKIVFAANGMIVNDTYDIDLIEKIEFYEDLTSTKDNISNPKIADRLYFAVTNNLVKIDLHKSTKVEVFLYKVNGQRQSVLYNGAAQAGTLNIFLTEKNLAKGFYTVAVKVGNTFYAKKLIIK